MNEAFGLSFGAAIYTAPEETRGTDVGGHVATSLFVDQDGLPIWEIDSNSDPINDVVWNDNDFYETTFQPTIIHTMSGNHDVSGLNSAVISRTNGSTTTKSVQDNAALGGAPVVGAIRAVPRKIIPVTAAGDTDSSTRAYVGYAWSGGSATLNGQGVSGGSGFQEVSSGIQTLSVNGQQFQATVAAAAAPSAILSANPSSSNAGQAVQLSWNVTNGSFLGASIDQGVASSVASSGAVTVYPTATTTYRLFVSTKEGGVVVERTVFVGETPEVFSDGFESGSFSAW